MLLNILSLFFQHHHFIFVVIFIGVSIDKINIYQKIRVFEQLKFKQPHAIMKSLTAAISFTN